MIRHLILAVALAASPALALAQTPAPAASEPAPDRLAKAKDVIALILPEAQRDAMMRGVIQAVNANVQAGLGQMLQGQQLNDAQRKILQDFLERQQKRSQDQIIADMPALMDAMARAYARQFSLAELDDLKTFFASPTGKIYTARSMGMMSDPDVAAVQTRMMQNGMAGMQDDIKAMATEMRKAGNAKAPAS